MRQHSDGLEEIPTALTPELALDGSTKPVLFHCSDGRDYCVKSSHAGRTLIADHIVGKIGHSLGFPVPRVAVVDVGRDVIEQDGSICAHFRPGLAHATEWVVGASDYPDMFRFVRDDGNPERFVQLAVLYGLTHAGDHQFIYKKTVPHLVYSVDHGLFFPAGDAWSSQSLRDGSGGPYRLDQLICSYVSWSYEQRESALLRLHRFSDHDIARIVRSVPVLWAIQSDERVCICDFLRERRDGIVDALMGRNVA